MRALQRLGVISMVVSLAVCQTWHVAKADGLLDTEGSLTSSDDVLDDGSLYDRYQFSGNSGQRITISLESQDFDPYLILLDPQGRRISENDDISRSDRNSRLVITLPATGIYTVVANSYESNTGGGYTIKVDQGSNRSSSPQELAATIPNSTARCNTVLVEAVDRLESNREIGVLVSALDFNGRYQTFPAGRPNGLSVALTGPASASVIGSPRLLTTVSREMIQGCSTLGAIAFGAVEAGAERTFGYFPARGDADQASVEEFTCAPSTLARSTNRQALQRAAAPIPEWGQQMCL